MSESVFGSITKYAVSGKASTEAFGELRDVAVSLIKSAGQSGVRVEPQELANDFNECCHEAEVEFMEINYANDPDAEHTAGKRNGQWKFRTFLPGAYSSAKTELGKGLEAGLDVEDKAKSALTKERKAATTTPETDGEKITRLTTALKRAIAAVSEEGDRRGYRQAAISSLTTQ